ncbi:hypothetical protein NicSoilE8_05220 [Arthrobacter sp. NicSoilE8]|nr:hypothetical protein NicSoilE8_05220 [Arthrobacter sp. NicSoilE8]
MRIDNSGKWTLEPANRPGDGTWLLTNETGEDAQHIHVGIDNGDALRVESLMEYLDDVTFAWSNSPGERVRVGWASSKPRGS